MAAARTDADPDPEVRRLRWLCRRGMRELDIKLERYLAECWQAAGTTERADFRRLLDAQDPEIWRWLLGQEPTPDPGLEVIITRLRGL